MVVCLFEYVLLVIIGGNVLMVGTVLWGQIIFNLSIVEAVNLNL